jgi:hypothetical protein
MRTDFDINDGHGVLWRMPAVPGGSRRRPKCLGFDWEPRSTTLVWAIRFMMSVF